MELITLTINGAKYVAVPEAEYDRLRSGAGEKPDGADWARAALGRTLQRARKEAGLSQEQLASKLRKSQTLVSRAESGELSVSERYVASVLKACGLPKDWPATSERKGQEKRGKRKRAA
jgi:ribosome-binding protein aMBF1 (putative translation factor)